MAGPGNTGLASAPNRNSAAVVGKRPAARSNFRIRPRSTRRHVFFNSLRFTWVMALLADAVVLLRARALLGRPFSRPLLAHLMPVQLALERGVEPAPPF